MTNENTKSNKLAALITYALALVCLLLGLFLPLNGMEMSLDGMIALQLPEALNSVADLSLSLDFAKPFTLSYEIILFGMVDVIVDLGAWLALLYAVVTVVALICLIPVIAGNKQKNTSKKVAFFAEALALFFLTLLVLTHIHNWTIGAITDVNLQLLIAFGGALLMLIVQSFMFKGGSGFVKFILFLLSAVAIVFVAFPVTEFIPQLEEPLANIAGETFVLGIGGNELINTTLSDYFVALVYGGIPESLETMDLMILIFGGVISVLVLVNLLLDLLGLAKNTSKFMLVCNVIRYALTLIAVIVLAILLFIAEGYTLGIMLILLGVISVIQLTINIIRLISFKPARQTDGAKANKKSAAKDEQPEEQREQVKKAPREKQKKVKNEEYAPAPATRPEEGANGGDRNYYYTVRTIYEGPTDEFIKKLSDEEKAEFHSVFIERTRGALSVIPEYKVGGDNSKFFSYVIIYYSRVRDIISTGLMTKIYEEGKML